MNSQVKAQAGRARRPRANATEYGLAAGIVTSDINISRRVSREIHAGTVWTNTRAAINDGFAEGGFKQTGIGRLRGPLAITGARCVT